MEDRHPKRHPGRDGGQEVAEPIRTCIGCRKRRPQGELVRISAQDGTPRVASGRREAGRGAYVCGLAACAKLALQKERLARALRKNIDIATLAELGRQLAERLKE